MLVDTHAFLGWLFDDARLSLHLRDRLADAAQTVFVSSASVWEVATDDAVLVSFGVEVVN